MYYVNILRIYFYMYNIICIQYMYMQNLPSVTSLTVSGHLLIVCACIIMNILLIIFFFTGSYNGRSKPVYHSLLSGSSSGSCTDYCQFTSSSSLALQITTPLTPPTPSSLQSFQHYIDGEMTGSDFDEVSFSIIDRREYMYIAYCFMFKDLVA